MPAEVISTLHQLAVACIQRTQHNKWHKWSWCRNIWGSSKQTQNRNRNSTRGWKWHGNGLMETKRAYHRSI